MLFADATLEGVWTSGVCPDDPNSDCQWTATDELVDYQYWLSGSQGICISVSGTYPYKWKKGSCDGESIAICESHKQGKLATPFVFFHDLKYFFCYFC